MNESLLEIRSRPVGFGYRRQRWPLTRHHIVQIGWIEARLIIPHGDSIGLTGCLSVLIAGLLIGWRR